jgi:cell wall assembly regulator SMI1
MTAIEQIKAAQQAKLVDEDDRSVTFKSAPPLTSEQIESLQKQVGQPLPEELRSLLQFCAGIEGFLCEIDFTGRSMSYAQEEIFPNGLPIAADGFGNFWVLDLTPQTTQVAPVFFACHDAPVILYQSGDLASFLREMFRMAMPPHQSLVDDVHEDRLFKVWQTNPGVIDLPTASKSTDPMIRPFAERLPEYFQIVDLCNVKPGMGFSWGRYGPQTEVRRYGYEGIFGYGKPHTIDNAKPRTTGFWAKVFGR